MSARVGTSDARLEAMLRTGALDALDVELAYALTALAPSANDEAVRLAIALASRAVRDGHTCLVLGSVSPTEHDETADDVANARPDAGGTPPVPAAHTVARRRHAGAGSAR
jgi:hypothetical protein